MPIQNMILLILYEKYLHAIVLHSVFINKGGQCTQTVAINQKKSNPR